jgi:hypothetical protein
MNERKPGEKFTEQAKPFVEEMREMARQSYQKIISLGHDFGQKLQKTFNPAPGLGGNTNRTTTRQENYNSDDSKEEKKD